MSQSPSLCVVGCGKSKLSHAAPARELYTGPLFRDALGYATQPGRFAEVRIISAKHGLLRLDQVVEPYDLKLGSADADADGNGWVGAHTQREIEIYRLWRRCHGLPPLESITVLAGAPYALIVQAAVDRAIWKSFPRPEVLTPLAGLGTGMRRSWFKAQRERSAPAVLVASTVGTP